MVNAITILLFLQDSLEGKRKSSKRTFKTEQEILEFTLKYKQVLAERDAGNYIKLVWYCIAYTDICYHVFRNF